MICVVAGCRRATRRTHNDIAHACCEEHEREALRSFGRPDPQVSRPDSSSRRGSPGGPTAA